MRKILFLFLYIVFLSSQVYAFNPKLLFSGSTEVSYTTPDYVGDTQGDVAWNTALTLSYTIQAGSNRCYIGFAEWTENAGISSVTFGAVAMTLVKTEAAGGLDGTMYVCGSDCSALTGAQNFVITLDTNAGISGWIMQVDGCNMSDPIHVSNSVNQTIASTEITVTLDTTGQDNTLVVGGVGILDDAATYDDGVCASPPGSTLIGDDHLATLMTTNGSYMDKDSAGSANQCYDSDLAWTQQTAIVAAINPAGSP